MLGDHLIWDFVKKAMLMVTSLLFFANQSKMLPMKSEDVIDVWRSNFYNVTGEQHLLEIRADGTFSATEYKGTWKIVDKQLVMTNSEGKEMGRPLRFTGKGDHLTDNVPDGTNYDRLSTRQVNINFPGLWSTSSNTKAGPPTKTTFVIGDFDYQLDGKKGKMQILRGHVEFVTPKGLSVELWPSKDFNIFAEKKSGGFALYRLPSKPLEKAVLGKWIYWAGASRNQRVNVTFYSNGTYTYGKTKGTWAVDGDHIMIENFYGSVIQFLPPSKSGLAMRTEERKVIFWRF